MDARICYEMPVRQPDGRFLKTVLIPMETVEMTSLAEGYPKERVRVRKILNYYLEIPTGVFRAAMIEQVLGRADTAASSGDVVAMLRSYEEMKEVRA